MEGIKYVNLIEIGPVIIEIRGAENGELAVPVNNTLVSHTAFLAADTRPCVLILLIANLSCNERYQFATIDLLPYDWYFWWSPNFCGFRAFFLSTKNY